MVKLTPLILATLATLILASPEASARCIMSYCKDRAATASTPAPSTSWAITNTSRQRLGDIYNPGHGRRLQIRNNHRQIIGYIEHDGTVTNTHRQKVGTLNW
jgi:hypothetical protein